MTLRKQMRAVGVTLPYANLAVDEGTAKSMGADARGGCSSWRALMTRSRLLLVDEISEGLQPSVVDRIAAILRAEREERGIAMPVVEQNRDFAPRVADRWAVLKRGEVDDAGVSGPAVRGRILEHSSIRIGDENQMSATQWQDERSDPA